MRLPATVNDVKLTASGRALISRREMGRFAEGEACGEGAGTGRNVEAMKGQNIVCFAKDWSEAPTSNNHVMILLAQENKVLWLNSIAMRRPTFTSGRDLSKVWQKLKSFFWGAQHPTPNLWVVTPIVLPFPHSRFATAVNGIILRATIGYYQRKLNIREFQLWTFLPNVVEYVGKLGESLLVYYCIDEWSACPALDGQKMFAMERRLMQRADLCFMTSHLLFASKKHINSKTFLASHGVDHAHFVKALAPETVIPTEITALLRPIIGFFGLIDERIDLALLAYIARMRSDWSIVLIGKSIVDTSAFKSLPNVYFLGRRPYEALPDYCRAFDVGIIPYEVNELTRNINPIKLREYLSAGLPVVSTDLPEIRFYNDQVYIASGHDEFIVKVEQAIRENSRESRQIRSDSVREETWEARVNAIAEYVVDVRDAKARVIPG